MYCFNSNQKKLKWNSLTNHFLKFVVSLLDRCPCCRSCGPSFSFVPRIFYPATCKSEKIEGKSIYRMRRRKRFGEFHESELGKVEGINGGGEVGARFLWIVGWNSRRLRLKMK